MSSLGDTLANDKSKRTTDSKNQPTLISPISRPSLVFHAHCFQFLRSVSVPLGPIFPFIPRDPEGPATPLSPFAPSRPSRPGNPLYPFTPLRPGRPGDPCKHVFEFYVKSQRKSADKTILLKNGSKNNIREVQGLLQSLYNVLMYLKKLFRLIDLFTDTAAILN